jgi:outer membrane protein assembly factor BamB
MKRPITLLCLFAFALAHAQEPFPQVFKEKFPVKVEGRSSNKDITIVYGRHSKGVVAMSAVDGKILWEINFEKDFGIKEFDGYRNLEYSEVLVYYTKETKKAPSEKVFVDAKTGKLLWRTTEFGTAGDFEKGMRSAYDREGNFLGDKGEGLKFYDIRTGQFAADVQASAASEKDMLYFGSITAGDLFIELSYEDKPRAASSGKRMSEVEVVATNTATNKVAWRTTFEGNIVAPVCWNGAFSGVWTGAPITDVILDWEVNSDQIFIYYDGIAALDLKTGKLQWQNTYDRSDMDFGLKITQVFNTACLPVLTDDALYYADLSDKENAIKKINRKTGALLWKSEELKKSDIVPSMYLENGKLICQFGGVQVQQIYYDGNCKSQYEPVGNFGLRAYDAATGKEIWNTATKGKTLTEDFNKMISNVLMANDIVYAHGNEFLLGVDAASGAEKFATSIKDLKVGKPLGMTWLEADKTILLRAEKGIVTIDANGGKVLASTKIDAYYGEFEIGGNFFVWVGKAEDDTREFVCIDLKSGKIIGLQKDTPYPDFAPDGSYFLKYDGETVYRFNVK